MDIAIKRTAVTFDKLPGWAEDDHAAAFVAFQRSCARLLAIAQRRAPQGPTADLVALCLEVETSLKRRALGRAEARTFFEAHFVPEALEHKGPQGFVTGYYEPLIKGSRTQSGAFQTPVLKRPADLVNVVAETQRASKQEGYTHLRKMPDGSTRPYFTRREIEEGALKGRGLEFIWLADPVEAFFMHVQGSARIAFADGTFMRITYDGKNGHPYTSVGRKLIEANVMGADRMTLGNLGQWLRADAKRGREAMWLNNSYVFFRELSGPNVDGPLGSLEIPLTPGRSLAVDTAFHQLGLPIYVSAPSLKHWAQGARGQVGFHRLMIAQDVGSAIKGPERGDVFFGAGDEAGRIAGQTKNAATFYVLKPKPREGAGVVTSAAPGKSKP
jgi:membrane-bound lytic murein transglycosylase A